MAFPPDAADISLITTHFPSLISAGYNVTSPETPEYNCIGWAAGDDARWWWPSGYGGHYWPSGVPLQPTLESFRLAFEGLGYEVCQTGELEDGIEKVAIYADSRGEVQHGARQLESGAWTSKLGEAHDIEHNESDGVSGQIYGTVQMFMSRARRESSTAPRTSRPDASSP